MQVIQDELIVGNEGLSKALKAGCEKPTLFVHCNLIDIDVFGLIWELNAKFYSCTIEKCVISFQSSAVFIDSIVRQSKLSGGDLEAVNTLFEDSSFAFSNEYTTDCTYSCCEGQNVSMACPTHGAFIGWKKCYNYDMSPSFHLPEGETYYKIVKLLIPESALRSSAGGAKCRASEAVVLEVYDEDGLTVSKTPKARSLWDYDFVYEKGKKVEPQLDFFDYRWEECGSGIHFFVDIADAINYDW